MEPDGTSVVELRETQTDSLKVALKQKVIEIFLFVSFRPNWWHCAKREAKISSRVPDLSSSRPPGGH